MARAAKTRNFPLASYADKPPTAVQRHFASWIEEMTGYEVDLQSVALAKALHSEWQASPERQEMLEQRRHERELALQRRQRGRPAGRSRQAEPEEAEEPEEPEEEAPAPRRRRAATTRRRTPKAAAPEPDLDDLDGDEDGETAGDGEEAPRASALAGPAPRRRPVPY
jgi:hypothetical protein